MVLLFLAETAPDELHFGLSSRRSHLRRRGEVGVRLGGERRGVADPPQRPFAIKLSTWFYCWLCIEKPTE